MSDKIRGLIFNKVQGSFVDGFGIRTTIFLKGCPLRCKWCCNPEGQSFRPELKVTYDKCTGCGHCAGVCPTKNIKLVDGKPTWNKTCIHCMACICTCPTAAMEYGRGTAKKVRYTCPKP